MSLPRYPQYKDSGVGWLGKVPVHWQVYRLKNLFEIRKRIVGEEGHQVLSITQRGIKVKDIESNDGQLSMDYSKYQIVHPGDFAMNHMDLLTGFVDISPYAGVTSPDYRVFAVRDGVLCDPRYFLYLLQNAYRQKIFYAFGQGASEFGRWRFPTDQFNDFRFPYPPPGEQTAIAAFLDRETGKIDALIAEQEKLLTLLAEKRQATISHAVTKGLDSDVPMKDSGVAWMGKVPAHWELKALKRAVTLQRGHDLPSEQREEGVFPVVSSGGISGYHSQAMSGPTVVTGRYGTIGEFVLIETDCWPLNTALYAVEMYDNIARYIWYMLQSLSHVFILNSLKSAVPGVDRNDVHPTTVCLPAPDEQQRIITFLDKELAKLDTLKTESESAIALLKERRSALIAAAVTGQIDVRKLPGAD